MKKNKKVLPQLNKSSVLKLVIFIAIIVLVEVAAGLFIFSQFSSKTYKQEYASLNQNAGTLTKNISTQIDSAIDSGIENKNSPVLAEIKERLGYDTNFDFYIIVSDTGRIIDDGGMELSDKLGDYGLKYNVAEKVTINGVVYYFAPSALANVNGDSVTNSGYNIGCLKDFGAQQKVIDNMLGNMVAILVVAGVLIVAAGVALTYLLNSRSKADKFKYKITVDKSGKILHANSAFKHEFSATSKIVDPDKLDSKAMSLVSLSGNYGDKLVAMRMTSRPNRSIVYGADIVNADSFIQSEDAVGEFDSDGKTTASLSKVFENFTLKGKRTLLGILYISSLDRIKTLFGKQMATDIQRIILKKSREKFTHAYELDFAYIGVTYPDGKKLDILLADIEDILRYINAPIKMDDNLFTVDVKSGFAMCDASMNPLNFEYAYKAAEAARQRVMDTKIADYIIYHESQRKLYEKYFITYDIKQMLAEGAFEMEYQPQYNIKEERIEGFEALFRVKKSWNVNVDTFSFITYAERTGAMVQLGDFIFDTGMAFAKKLEGKDVSVSLNVSPVQLMQAGFTENFLKLYKKYNLKPRSICVEITESFLMTNFNETLKKLDILTANGIDVHLDDFGTEYSSLLYIKKLPISTIKIDKEFVKDVLTSKESQAIIKFITNIAKLLNRTTICEGVETTQEFDMLNYLGCDTIQGWLIGKSMKPEDALKIVDTFDYKRVAAAKNGK